MVKIADAPASRSQFYCEVFNTLEAAEMSSPAWDFARALWRIALVGDRTLSEAQKGKILHMTEFNVKDQRR